MNEGELKNKIALQTYWHNEGNLHCGTISSEAVRQLVDEAAKEFHDWMANQPTLNSGFILQAKKEQRNYLLKGAMAGWMMDIAILIDKWFGEEQK